MKNEKAAFLIVAAFLLCSLVPMSSAWSQELTANTTSDFLGTTAFADGSQLDAWQLGGTYVGLSNFADYQWTNGCSPTAAGMLIGYYDRNGYAGKSYRNLVPGGVAESSTYNTPAYSTLAQSMMASQRHVNDFYRNGYNATGDDVVGAPTGPLNCLADFMGTSQDALSNPNGQTMFYNYTNGPVLDVAGIRSYGAAYYNKDGMYGIYEYLGYRGYQNTNPSTEHNVFSQYVSPTTSSGFTLAQYKTEIDSGRPVIIQLSGHSVLGVGYDSSASSQIYVLDTWTPGVKSMAWDSTYNGMDHFGVTVVRLDGVGAEANAVGGTANEAYDDDGFTTGTSHGSTAGLTGNALATTMAVTGFDPGSDGWESLKFFYSDQELSEASIANESLLRMYWWDTSDSRWEFDGTGTFHVGAPQGGLGDYGIDLANNYAWINVNHASDWALSAVMHAPEPSTLALACTALAFGAFVYRRRRG